MTCAEFQEIAAAYALDSLEADEKVAAEGHLREERHQGCLEALARALGAAGALARALPALQPDPSLWRRIEDATAARPRSRRLREGAAWAAAAAAAIALLLVQGARMRERTAALAREQELAALRGQGDRERATCRAQLQALQAESALQRSALALLDSPSARVVALGAAPGARVPARATAIIDGERKRGFLVASALTRTPGKDYELWVLRGKAAPLPAGLLRSGATGMVLSEIAPALLQPGLPDALAVSIEPEGGSAAPSKDIILVGAVPKA